jgi:hypothetical protein
LTEDNWVERLKKIKEETEREIQGKRLVEQQLREKYKDEKTKIFELLRSELNKVVEIFKDPSLQEFDQPKAEIGNWGARLSVPIVHSGTHVGLEIKFFPQLTDKGYALTVAKGMFDGIHDKSYDVNAYIPPPVTANAIQTQVMDFLEARSNTIKSMEESTLRFQREW